MPGLNKTLTQKTGMQNS